MAINQYRRLRGDDLVADEKALIGIQALPGYAPRDEICSSENLTNMSQKMLAAQQDEIRAVQAMERARIAAIAAEWEVHNLLLKAKQEVRAQFGDESDAMPTLGLKRKSERKRPMRRSSSASSTRENA